MHIDLSPTDEAEIKKFLTEHPEIGREQLLKHVERDQELTASARAPFPGPTRAAFASQPPVVMGYTLQPVNMALLSALEQIDSPFVKMVELIAQMQGQKAQEISRAIDKKFKIKIETLVATAFCFVKPIDWIETELGKGPMQFRKTATRELGQVLDPIQFRELNDAILLHYIASFSTSVEYRAKKAGGGSFPLAPAEPKTGSVGACISAEP